MNLELLFVEFIIPLLQSNFYSISIIGTVISTNLFVIFLGSLAGQGIFELWKVWLLAVIGILISDLIWFNLGKTNLIHKVVRHKYFLYNFYSIKYLLNKSEEKNYFVVFLTSKFVYGLKIITLMNAGKRNMHLDDFIKYDFPVSIGWSTFLVLFSFLAGRGFGRLVEILNSIKGAVSLFILIIVSVYIAWFISGRIIMRSWKRINDKVGDKIIVPKLKYHKFKNRFS